MAFYTYIQMNPGGQFDKTMPHYLIIEATNADDANERAEDAGAYFDGVDAGQDCACCGDRWCRAQVFEATTDPILYGVSVLKALSFDTDQYKGRAVRVVYANGVQIDIHVKEK